MGKIFFKIYLKFNLECFHFIDFRILLLCYRQKKKNSNKYYITVSCIPCNI